MQMLDYMLTMMVAGAACFGIARFLDKSMDYGHILGEIRYRIMYAFAGDMRLNLVEQKKNQSLEFQDRLMVMDDLYWQIASKKGFLTLIICRVCMSVWVCLAAWVYSGFGFMNLVLIISGNYLIMIFDK